MLGHSFGHLGSGKCIVDWLRLNARVEIITPRENNTEFFQFVFLEKHWSLEGER